MAGRPAIRLEALWEEQGVTIARVAAFGGRSKTRHVRFSFPAIDINIRSLTPSAALPDRTGTQS